jgi:CDP-diacylglycerol---serine O-phosphatidyltransferase
MKQVPNLFTLLNLVFGCLAIVFALQTGETLVAGDNYDELLVRLPEKMTWAAACIGIAAVIDFLDGFVARLFKASSEMGKQLDSLADVVSFGAAPGIIMYQLLRLSFAQGEGALDLSMIWLLPAFMLPAAAAWRLARFNLDNSQSYGFKGVPVPAMGLVVASFPLIIYFSQSDTIVRLLLNHWILYAIIALLSYLMVSTLPIMALKFKDFSLKNNIPKLILLGVAAVAGIFFQWLAVPIVFAVYILLSLLLKNQEA